MQREIKFRGKRVDTGEWVYGYYYELDGIPYIIEKGTGFFSISNGEVYFGTAYIHEVIPETVGQYTGLKDKNGKEIYEGDIVRAENGEVFIVKYGEHATSEWNDNWEIGFYVESTSEEEISRGIRTDIVFWVKYRALEVIGNIHDNPELLQEEQCRQ